MSSLSLPGHNDGWTIKQQGSLRLYIPTSKARWSEDTRWFRSLIVNRQDEPVSVGLPKFHSPHRDPEAWTWALEQGDRPRLLRKLDGSLILRSVDRGRVLWRTRGAFELGGFQARVQSWLKDHPAGEHLNDPEWMPDHTLWMEWLDPIQRVVVRHGSPRLILLGGVDNAKFTELTRAHVLDIADNLSWEACDEIAWPENLALDDLPEWVNENFSREEGVVCVWENSEGIPEQRLRLKSRAYLTEHAKRFQYNPTAILNAYLKASGSGKKGKAKKRQGDIYERVFAKLHIGENTHPDVLAWICKCVDEIIKIEGGIEEEWLHLIKRSKHGHMRGDDAVQTTVLKGMAKSGRAKSLLQHHRRHAWIQFRSGS